jgi:hypothetical protein
MMMDWSSVTARNPAGPVSYGDGPPVTGAALTVVNAKRPYQLQIRRFIDHILFHSP